MAEVWKDSATVRTEQGIRKEQGPEASASLLTLGHCAAKASSFLLCSIRQHGSLFRKQGAIPGQSHTGLSLRVSPLAQGPLGNLSLQGSQAEI